LFELDEPQLAHLLKRNDESTQMEIPTPSGELIKVHLTAAEIMHPDLASKFPDIRHVRRPICNAGD